jgi:acetylornithine deacetylase/succinyl-diaminopimelate desuccinylase-like protein
MQLYSDLAQRWMQEYVRIDTSNPPGNEARAVDWMSKIIDQENIEFRVYEIAPNRSLLWAILRGTSRMKKRPIVLLNHTDVVTADASHWTHPPFAGEIANGVLYGRGAQDMKDEAIAQLVTLVMLKREKLPMERDVIFLASPDEEATNIGVDWVMKHTDLLGNAEFLINEGGVNREENGRTVVVGVDVAEKSPYWLHLVAHGSAGHGSRPLSNSAPNRLVRALYRIQSWEQPLLLLPWIEASLQRQAAIETGPRAAWFRNPRQALKDPRFRAYLDSDPDIAFMFRNTVSITMFGGSQQTNVIPPDAWANLDIRLLPGVDPAAFAVELKKVIADPNITFQQIGTFFKANAAPTDTALFRAIEKVSGRYFNNAPVIPTLTSGYNECQRYRELGIAAYGFMPYSATREETDTEHGNDERVRIAQVRRAPRVLYDVVADVATAQ